MDAEEVVRLANENASGPVRLGGNSSVTRARWHGREIAIKQFGHHDDSPERAGREWDSLTFLWAETAGIAAEPIGVSKEHGILVEAWIAGRHPSPPASIPSMLDLLSQLHDLASMTTYSRNHCATDAINEPLDLVDQVRARLTKLSLDSKLSSVVRRIEIYLSSKTRTSKESAPCCPTLSPSDFGPHNILLARGVPSLIDLEFFGWDDAHKLVADTLLHPLVNWSAISQAEFIAGVQRLYDLDPRRLEEVLELCRLKWSTIILKRASRLFAEGDNRGGRHSLAKAEAYVVDALEFGGQLPA